MNIRVRKHSETNFTETSKENSVSTCLGYTAVAGTVLNFMASGMSYSPIDQMELPPLKKCPGVGLENRVSGMFDGFLQKQINASESSHQTSLCIPLTRSNFEVKMVSIDDEVKSYISREENNYLVKIITDAIYGISSFFPHEKLKLKWSSDIEDKRLFLIITTEVEVEEAYSRYISFLNNWLGTLSEKRQSIEIGLDVV